MHSLTVRFLYVLINDDHFVHLFAEGKVIPTELQRDAGQLRKRMKFDDSEREGELMKLKYLSCLMSLNHKVVATGMVTNYIGVRNSASV